MEQSSRVGLDNTALRGRVKGYVSRPTPHVRPRQPHPVKQYINDYGELPAKHFSEYFRPKHEEPTPEPQLYFPIPQPRLRQLVGKGKNLVASVSRPYALVAAAVIFIVMGAYFGFAGFKSNQRIETQAKALSTQILNRSNSDSGTGEGTVAVGQDETPVTISAQTEYTVAPDMPRLLKIPAMGISARVKRITVDSNNVMGAPSNIYDVGWYDGGAKPGEKGAMFIDGHVSGPNDHGSFYDLKKLKAGDKIYVETGDYRSFEYIVVATEWFDANSVDMAKVLRPYDSTAPGLNLMTCGGRFNSSTQQFDQRVVVYSVLQNTP